MCKGFDIIDCSQFLLYENTHCMPAYTKYYSYLNKYFHNYNAFSYFYLITLNVGFLWGHSVQHTSYAFVFNDFAGQRPY